MSGVPALNGSLRMGARVEPLEPVICVKDDQREEAMP